MFTSRAKQQLSESIYRLKFEMGEPIVWIARTSSSLNVDTGEMVENLREYPINKAIVLPINMLQKAKYSITYLASNKNFVYDGMYEESNLGILIDLRDIPFRDFDKLSEELVRLQNGDTYEVARREYYAMEIALILHLKAVTNG